jgi:hypothetical protein
MKTPSEYIPHIQERRETSLVNNDGWVNAVTQSWEMSIHGLGVAACQELEFFRGSCYCWKPNCESRFQSFDAV